MRKGRRGNSSYRKCICFRCREKIMMKKYACKVLAAAMAVSMMVPGVNVLAATTTNSGSETDTQAETKVKYSVSTSYEWSVPTEIEFTKDSGTIEANADSGNTQKVKVTKNVIPNGQKLHIVAEGDGTEGAFQIKETAHNNVLPFNITVGDESTVLVAKTGTVLDVEAGINAKSVKLTFKLQKENVEKTGEYSGKVTYTSSIIDE